MARRTSSQTDSPPSVVGPGTTPYSTRTTYASRPNLRASSGYDNCD